MHPPSRSSLPPVLLLLGAVLLTATTATAAITIMAGTVGLNAQNNNTCSSCGGSNETCYNVASWPAYEEDYYSGLGEIAAEQSQTASAAPADASEIASFVKDFKSLLSTQKKALDQSKPMAFGCLPGGSPSCNATTQESLAPNECSNHVAKKGNSFACLSIEGIEGSGSVVAWANGDCTGQSKSFTSNGDFDLGFVAHCATIRC